MKQILITGVGRSGTKHTAELLNKCGLEIGHEEPKRNGLVSWKHVIFKNHFDIILHQIREPQACISSLHTIQEESMLIMAKHIGIDRTKPFLYQAMQVYLYWNLLCDNAASYTYKVESLPTIWNELSSRLEIDCDLPAMDKNVNSRKDRDTYEAVTWEDMKSCSVELYDRVRWYAEHVGYL